MHFTRSVPASSPIGSVGAVPIYLVRHAHAGSRRKWEGPDAERPLSRRGRDRAEEIGVTLGGVGVARILSSPYLRCVQTVEPLAATLDLPLEHTTALAEGAALAESVGLVEDLAATGTVAALCSHGDVIPDILAGLARRGADVERGTCPKGSIWVLHTHEGVVTAARDAGTGPLPQG
jgi:phosphohistidine phosphatase SixA